MDPWKGKHRIELLIPKGRYSMKIVLCADHRGVDLKDEIKEMLKEMGHKVIDVGTHGHERVDYPDFGEKAALLLAKKEVDRAIGFCGTGMGMAMVANKIPGIRAVPAFNVLSAIVSRERYDANFLSIPALLIGYLTATEAIKAWLTTEFEGGRHIPRIEKISALDEKYRRI